MMNLIDRKLRSSSILRPSLVPALILAVFGSQFAQGAIDSFPPLEKVGLGKPLVSTRESQFDFTSKITGRSYRLMIAAPYQMDPAKTYPVVYILDGYWYFRPAVDFDTEAGGRLQSAIIVGIGYPTDDYKEQCDRRNLDLCVSPDPSAKASEDIHPADGDAFLRMIQDEVKPFVEKRYPVDKSQQTLYGKSSGGITVLRQLFRNPSAFQTYIAASPAIFYNNKAVLEDETAFSQQAKAGKLHFKLLITSAELEQYRGSDPQQLESAKRKGMVDNASDLAARMKLLDTKDIVVDYVLFPGESHFSVSPASLGRGLSFALKTESK
jgi:predicted alpha/beta superfamily hydrolase